MYGCEFDRHSPRANRRHAISRQSDVCLKPRFVGLSRICVCHSPRLSRMGPRALLGARRFIRCKLTLSAKIALAFLSDIDGHSQQQPLPHTDAQSPGRAIAFFLSVPYQQGSLSCNGRCVMKTGRTDHRTTAAGEKNTTPTFNVQL